MSRGKLIIIESEEKVRTFKRLHPDASAFATSGQFKQLPEHGIGIDLETYDPQLVVPEDKQQMLRTLHYAAQQSGEVYIATGPDREGYAIGQMIYDEIKNHPGVEIYRAEINEITQKGIEEGIRESSRFTETDSGKYDSFLARKIGDRMIGYLLSPVLSRELNGKHSVGRVQSCAVKLLVEQERKIAEWKMLPATDKFYYMAAIRFKINGTEFTAYHPNRFETQDKCEKMIRSLGVPAAARVKNIQREEETVSPMPPMTTAALQQAANQKLGLDASTTMQAAKALFEGYSDGEGLITFYRTESSRLSVSFLDECERFIKSNYVGLSRRTSYTPDDPRRAVLEAIRPTTLVHPSRLRTLIPASEPRHHFDLYKLIYATTMASQMQPCVVYRSSFTFSYGGEDFVVVNRATKEKGYRAIYEDVFGKTAAAVELHFKVGEEVEITGIAIEKKAKRGPSRYTEGQLIERMDRLMIGRPSTYASILSVIKKRGYASVHGRELVPSSDAFKLIDKLEEKYPFVVDYAFTAQMERLLDDIESGAKDWKEFCRELHGRLDYIKPPGHTDPAPSKKHADFATNFAKLRGLVVPKDALQTKNKLSAWLKENEHVPITAISTGKTKSGLPSQAQVDYAKKIEMSTGILIGAAFGSAEELSNWICLHEHKVPATKGQLSFARQIATAKGISIPDDMIHSKVKLGEWIKKHQDT